MAGRESLVRTALEAPTKSARVESTSKALDLRRRETGRCGSVPHHRVSNRRRQGRRSNMAEVKIFHDREGQTLTVWFTDPSLEYVSEETGDEVVLMKDVRAG